MRLSFLSAIAAAWLSLVWFGCEESPTEGEPNTPQDTTPVNHFELYGLLTDAAGEVLVVWDVPADTVLDTLPLNGVGYDVLVMTPDSNRLYVSSTTLDRTVVVTLRPPRVERTLDRGGRFFFDGGRDVAVRIGNDGIITYTLSTTAPRDSLMRAVGFGAVDTATGRAYAATRHPVGAQWLYTYDYAVDSLVDSTIITDGQDTLTYVGEMAVTPSGDRLYLLGSSATGSHLYVYDLQTRTVTARYPRRQPLGRFLLGTQGRLLYVSDPDVSSAFTSGRIWVYDLAGDRLTDSLTTVVPVSGGGVTVSVSTMAMTPDGRYLYSSGTTGSVTSGALLRQALPHGEPSFVTLDFFPTGPVELLMGREMPSDTTSGP